MKRKAMIQNMILILFFTTLAILNLAGLQSGRQLALTAGHFGFSILKILPCAFILIGLFEVWVKKETVERHFGETSGMKGHFWGILLAGTTVGGAYLAFPIAATLYRKGARLAVILTYIGASAVARIPMTIFEATFIGLKFTIVRYVVSLPLIVLSSELLARLISTQKEAV